MTMTVRGKVNLDHYLFGLPKQKVFGRKVVTGYVLVELGSALAKVTDRHPHVPFVKHLLADSGTLFIPASSKSLSPRPGSVRR